MANYRVSIADDAFGDTGPDQAPARSFFGHDPGLNLHLPPGNDLPVQLVLTPDNRDPQVAALATGIKGLIRLLHPYHYSEGQSFAYRHRGGAVEFMVFPGEPQPSWPTPDLPAAFPARPLRFVSLADRRGLVRWDKCAIYLGADSPIVQRYNGVRCVACSRGTLRLLTSVPSRPIPELNVWNNDCWFALFWVCPSCKAIVTHNECD